MPGSYSIITKHPAGKKTALLLKELTTARPTGYNNGEYSGEYFPINRMEKEQKIWKSSIFVIWNYRHRRRLSRKTVFCSRNALDSAAGDGQKLWMCTEMSTTAKNWPVCSSRWAAALPIRWKEADIALYNTCAVRENAEQKVFWHHRTGSHQKASRREMLIGVCGCMAQQEHVSEKIRKSFPRR